MRGLIEMSPVYHIYQAIIIREKVAPSMQGRIFSLQGMITQALTPLGFLMGGILADYASVSFYHGETLFFNVWIYLPLL